MPNTIRRYAAWLFWMLWYLPQPRPKELEAYLVRSWRTRRPWWTFKPNVYRNEDGNMWQVYLSNSADYVKPRQTLAVDLHICRETGKVVGFDVWDETLAKFEEERDAE